MRGNHKFLNVMLNAMRKRNTFYKLYTTIDKAAFSESVNDTLDLFNMYFKSNEQQEIIDDNVFLSWCELSHKFSDKSRYDKDLITSNMKTSAHQELPQDVEEVLLNKIIAENAATAVMEAINKYRSGEDINLLSVVKNEVDKIECSNKKKIESSLVLTSIEEMLERSEDNYGLKWRLNCLNKSMRPLQPGDFGIIAARPDAGKSSFIASEITYFASQLEEGYPVLWLNNEGPGDRIKLRCYQAAINATISDLVDLQKSDTLNKIYAQETGGSNQIIIRDVHDFTSIEIEELIKEDKPAVIIFDMIDNIKFSGINNNNGQRTDQILENMYQWARALGVRYNCAVLATSQISGDGEGMHYPLMTMLKDSKTGKQGAADFILMIGKDTERSDVRYISLPKNKLRKQGSASDPRSVVSFDGQRSRYKEDVFEKEILV